MPLCGVGLCGSCSDTGFSSSDGGARFSLRKKKSEVIKIRKKLPKTMLQSLTSQLLWVHRFYMMTFRTRTSKNVFQ